MRDYAELVKALRCCSKIDARNNGCDSCSYEYCGDDCQNLCGCAADAIEELLAQKQSSDERGEYWQEKYLHEVPQWISVEEQLPKRTNPLHARDTYLVRLESGCIKTLFYEYDNSDRCRPGMSPLFSEGWEKTAVPVTHWMPLPAPPKGVE